MKIQNLQQVIVFKAKPSEVYEALLDEGKHTAFTGFDAYIEPEVGGEFVTNEGYSKGITIKLVKNKKIVQKWTCADFPTGYFTEIVFDLHKEGKGTKLIFTQKNIPDDQYEGIAGGWNEFYWKPLKNFLAHHSFVLNDPFM